MDQEAVAIEPGHLWKRFLVPGFLDSNWFHLVLVGTRYWKPLPYRPSADTGEVHVFKTWPGHLLMSAYS